MIMDAFGANVFCSAKKHVAPALGSIVKNRSGYLWSPFISKKNLASKVGEKSLRIKKGPGRARSSGAVMVFVTLRGPERKPEQHSFRRQLLRGPAHTLVLQLFRRRFPRGPECTLAPLLAHPLRGQE